MLRNKAQCRLHTFKRWAPNRAGTFPRYSCFSKVFIEHAFEASLGTSPVRCLLRNSWWCSPSRDESWHHSLPIFRFVFLVSIAIYGATEKNAVTGRIPVPWFLLKFFLNRLVTLVPDLLFGNPCFHICIFAISFCSMMCVNCIPEINVWVLILVACPLNETSLDQTCNHQRF